MGRCRYLHRQKLANFCLPLHLLTISKLLLNSGRRGSPGRAAVAAARAVVPEAADEDLDAYLRLGASTLSPPSSLGARAFRASDR